VLFALRVPISFVVLIVAFFAGLAARGFAQRLVMRQRRPAWARNLTRRTSLVWLRPFVDPYGVVAALLGGAGWGMQVDINTVRSRPGARLVSSMAAGPVVLGALGVAALEAFRVLVPTAKVGDMNGRGVLDTVRGTAYARDHLHYVLGLGPVALYIAGVLWLTMAIVALVPLPPLDGGKFLFALGPTSPGWQKARYRLNDDNWGTVALIALMLPLIGWTPILLGVLSYGIDPLIRVLT
jgi:hypothetical protein